jgi:hypothetical protein
MRRRCPRTHAFCFPEAVESGRRRGPRAHHTRLFLTCMYSCRASQNIHELAPERRGGTGAETRALGRLSQRPVHKRWWRHQQGVGSCSALGTARPRPAFPRLALIRIILGCQWVADGDENKPNRLTQAQMGGHSSLLSVAVPRRCGHDRAPFAALPARLGECSTTTPPPPGSAHSPHSRSRRGLP